MFFFISLAPPASADEYCQANAEADALSATASASCSQDNSGDSLAQADATVFIEEQIEESEVIVGNDISTFDEEPSVRTTFIRADSLEEAPVTSPAQNDVIVDNQEQVQNIDEADETSETQITAQRVRAVDEKAGRSLRILAIVGAGIIVIILILLALLRRVGRI